MRRSRCAPRTPRSPVLVLSQYVEERYATELIAGHGGALGYLLKDRVADVRDFLASIERIGAGATVLDPEVVAQLLTRRPATSGCSASPTASAPCSRSSPRASRNQAIAATLFSREASVEKHITAIFQKLDLEQDESGNRRVLAALVHLEHGGVAADRSTLMSTTTPLPPARSAPPAPPPPTRGASRVIAILTIALGCAVVLGVIGSATFSTIAAARSAPRRGRWRDGVTGLDVPVDAASLRIEFADVPSDARGHERRRRGRLDPRARGRRADRRDSAPAGPGWICGAEETGHAHPAERDGGPALDTALDLSAGELTIDGEFGDLEIEVDAGTLSRRPDRLGP